MKSVILICSIILFIGCGESSNQNNNSSVDKTKPASPITEDREKTPPSIPNI